MVSSSESSSESRSSSASCHSTLGPRWKRRRVPEYQCTMQHDKKNQMSIDTDMRKLVNECNAAVWRLQARVALQMSCLVCYGSENCLVFISRV